VWASTNDLGTALSKGLFEEEANHNLGAAIPMYQSVIDRFETDRKIVATAVFRLGECYRKQGSTNEAIVQYQRVLREFADQTELVTLGRQYLATLGGEPSGQSSPGLSTLPDSSAKIVDIGEISHVQAIIKSSPDLINAPYKNNETLLQTYAGRGDLDVVKLLLENGAAVNGIKQPDLTPLHFAAGRGRKSVVEFLLSKGAKPDAATASGVTPLHLAVLKGYELVAKVLLNSGANVNAMVQKDVSRGAEGLNSDTLLYTLQAYQSPLHIACQEGYPALVEWLISKGADVNAWGKGGTPLTIAVQANNESIVQDLLLAYADPNAGQPSALVLAAGQGNVPILNLLLSEGTNLNLTNALLEAVQKGQSKAVTRLLQSKANPNSIRENGEPLLFLAVYSPAVLKTLLDGGADPNQRGVQGYTPVERAVSSNPEALEMLLERGADPNAQETELGYTALHIAAQNLRLAAVQALLNHGANPNLQAKDGQTPLHFAVRWPNLEIARLLLEHGADPNLEDAKGLTPLYFARQYGPRRLPSTIGAPGSPPPATIPESGGSLQELLLDHGASADLPHMDRIEIRRSPSYSAPIFFRDNSGVNRFSILELLAVNYGFISAAPTAFGDHIPEYDGPSRTLKTALSFPNLEKIQIRRPKAGGKEWTMVTVSEQAILASGDCARDFGLEWGDQVNIPEADHPLSARWDGFSATVLTNLQKCVQRTVLVIIKGQTNTLRLEVPAPKSQLSQPSEYPFNYAPPQFCLVPALQRSGLLRSSSDVTHVKVKRSNSTTGENWEKTFDCSGTNSSSCLWLRDGDVIEVPDRP
jgi:ankyrin repeat protein